MPTAPGAFRSGPVSPQQLNTCMYSADASITGATGLLFHVHRPVLSESVINGGSYTAVTNQTVNSGGSGAGFEAFNIIDTSALFGLGADSPGTWAAYHFRNWVGASSGVEGTNGGHWLSWGFPYTGTVTNPPGAVGASMFQNSSASSLGIFQVASTSFDNCPWYLDILNAGAGSANTWEPGFWWLSGSVPEIIANDADTTGPNTRMGWMWLGTTLGAGTVTTVPAPVMSWGTVTSAALNTTLGSCLTYLNNPPVLRVTSSAAQSIPDSTNTTVAFSGVSIDNYGSWSTGASTYTAPLPGFYLFSPMTGWGTASASGIRRSGLQLTPGGTGVTQTFQGPNYKATPVGPGVTGVGMTGTGMVKVLQLRKGDVVSTYGFQNSGGALQLLPSYGSRLTGAYMSQVAATGTVLTYSIPDTTFRWQAGQLSGTALTAALNQHLGLDMAFIMNKPYFTGYQTAAQTINGDDFWFKVTMDTVGGYPFGGNGDNYGGWDDVNFQYVSQVAGWYLCIADLYAVPPVSGTVGVLQGGIFVSASGGISPSSSPDGYQAVYYPASTTAPPGVTAIGLYYLQPGERVNPVILTRSWGGTWGTYVSNSGNQVNSQFSCFWVSA